MGNHTTHSAFGIGHITFVSGDNMHMAMEYGLASSFAYVNSDIISIGMETLINFLLHILQYHIHGLALVVGQVEVRGDVPLGMISA